MTEPEQTRGRHDGVDGITGTDGITDVGGLRVGHARVAGPRALSGTTVVLAPAGGMVAAVDVRGGGPGTRETDALDPRNVVQRIDAVVLTGGSAYGLDSAAGVMAWLEERHRGVRVGPDPAHVVPVVPAACVFDLGRGGDFAARPDAATGRAAVAAADASGDHARVETGAVGAGTGAVVGGLRGGVGTASTVLESGITVGALVVVNAVGSALDPATGVLYGSCFTGDGPPVFPGAEVHEAAVRRLAEARAAAAPPPLNTTLAVVATDAVLTRAQAQKVAGTAHDGIARAVRPVHLMNDGDTVFALATGRRELPEGPGPLALNEILAAGADLVTRAIVRAVLAAPGGLRGPGGDFPSYGELYAPGGGPYSPVNQGS
ncbi:MULTISPECIES: P1 family peptidase [unclassified Streptomyces]|uniref:P1 family peptidase n=1 Tax=unclassified Streptomyces TaxID=2593676 RepID=UPI0006F338AC|nr:MULTISPECIES: P1 family peptidase [unclassified Streptomyces]KQX57940.1 hydrolase [Streptomyces sp. Root1304]KRA78824.1 hydrolase [Streptomyces sp. Root66D1]